MVHWCISGVAEQGVIAPPPSSKSGGLSPPKKIMNNKRMDEFQEHFYKLAETGSAKPLKDSLPPKIQISYIMI